MVAYKLPGIDAAVDCWGGRVVPKPEELTPRQPVPVIDMTPDLGCPLLGLFGEEDPNPSPEQVARIEQELKRHGKTHEFHMYESAGHGFFAVDRPAYRQHAAVDGWREVFAWFEKYLTPNGR
jgi:carboxymethylenebutenolidase